MWEGAYKTSTQFDTSLTIAAYQIGRGGQFFAAKCQILSFQKTIGPKNMHRTEHLMFPLDTSFPLCKPPP